MGAEDRTLTPAEVVYCITLMQVARMLGVSSRTVRNWIKDPEIKLPAYKIGNRLIFKKAEIDQFLTKHAVKPRDLRAEVDAILSIMRSSPKS